MGTVEETLKCPVCQDFFTDPVTLPCGHDFCLTCIQAVWETDESDKGPVFCPECQVFLPSDLTLEINTSLQTKVKDFTTNRTSTAEPRTTTSSNATKSSSTIHCDHCIDTPSVAIRTCLTCDASLCQAHALLHQQRSALREHTVVEVTGDLLSLKCREHRDELKFFCMEERVPVCCLCVLIGIHKNHKVSQLHEACTDFKKSAADFRERVSDKYSRIRVVLDGDERLMMQIIDAEETYMTEWLEARRGIMEAQIKEIDNLSSPALDSNSAHPKLEICQDKKQVFWRQQPVSEALSAQPYDSQYSVLTQESFTTGRHYWEVIVQEKPYWLIGVTTGSVNKKTGQSPSSLGVNSTSWCIYHGDGQYLACHDTQEKQLVQSLSTPC
ncbi:E3 ubiquitin/ISG15 ligase TRIM25-like [Chaetodon trifascialis]|uniref:E3 ubiquitin/ISG15 ligase TRIM25-like n=1 Tax=Chaetodon trifascialis TaxID=109706 RepID=UPI003991B6D8